MSQVKQIWKKLSIKLFFPEERRLLVWSLVAPVLLILSSLVLLTTHAPLQTLLLFLGALFLLSLLFAPKKITKFAFWSIALFSIYCLKGARDGSFLLEMIWTAQFLSSLYIGQKMILATREYISGNAESLKAIESDKELWESRFETLHEKIASDRSVWENEIELACAKAEEKIEYAESLRRLVETAHDTIRQLETNPPKPSEDYEALASLQHERETFLSTVDSMKLLKDKEDRILELECLLEKDDEGIFIDGKEINSEEVMRILTELNESREKSFQLETLLTDAKKQLEKLQNVVETRRTRNQELLKTNTTSSKPITLQGLAKRAKR